MKCQTISLLNNLFAAKGANYYVAMATVIFAHVKITIFTFEDIMFSRESSAGISPVLYNKPFNHNYNKILKSDWLSTALISALIGQFNRTVRVMPK